MENIRSQYVDSDIFHVSGMHFTLDRIFSQQLANVGYCHIRTAGISRVHTVACTRIGQVTNIYSYI